MLTRRRGRLTGDIDIISEGITDDLREACKAVAFKHNLAPDWINGGVKGFAVSVELRPERIFTGKCLILDSAGPLCQLAMKPLSGRKSDEERSTAQSANGGMMTLCEHISDIESVASLTGLGRQADQAALAAHRAEIGALADDDRAALTAARDLLSQLQSFAGVTVPSRAALQTRSPIAVLEEMFGTVSRAADQDDVGAFVERLIASIDSILAGSGTTDQIRSVAAFFDDLGAATLDRTAARGRVSPVPSPWETQERRP